MTNTQKIGFSLIAIVGLIVFPFVNPDPFTLFIFILALLWATVALYLNLLIGYGGIFFIAPMIFVAVGAYSSAWLSLPSDSATCPISGCAGLHPFQSITIGAALAVVSSFAISLLSTRIRGLYMALYSLVFLLFLGSIAIQTHPVVFYWTGGAAGLSDVPDIVVGDFGFRSLGGIAYYYLELGILIVAAVVLYALLKSNFGLAFRSLRDGETLAATLGINVLKMRVYAFMISAFFMGIAGGIWVHFFSSVGMTGTGGAAIGGPFAPSWIFFFLTILVYGGLGTFVGPIVGAFVLITLDQNLLIFGVWRNIIIGATVIAVLLIAPAGIVGKIQNYLAARKGESTATVPRILLERATGKNSGEAKP